MFTDNKYIKGLYLINNKWSKFLKSEHNWKKCKSHLTLIKKVYFIYKLKEFSRVEIYCTLYTINPLRVGQPQVVPPPTLFSADCFTPCTHKQTCADDFLTPKC